MLESVQHGFLKKNSTFIFLLKISESCKIIAQVLRRKLISQLNVVFKVVSPFIISIIQCA
jgi:hypothetical protein